MTAKKKTTGVPRQQVLNKRQLNCNNIGTVGNDVFHSVRAKGLYNEDTSSVTRVEAGSNTSTVALRVVGSDEKGSLGPETVKHGRESQGIGPQKDCAGKSHQHIQNTDPSSRRRGGHIKTRP
jgi:hypothetical protein